MKQPILFILCALLLSAGGCKQKPSNTGNPSPDTISTAKDTSTIAHDALLPDSLFFMLQDEPLPRQVSLNQDISHLSYNCLRLLRSYVYATHGHWFMEGDLNRFFRTHKIGRAHV